MPTARRRVAPRPAKTASARPAGAIDEVPKAGSIIAIINAPIAPA
jgi:hypothetical protein